MSNGANINLSDIAVPDEQLIEQLVEQGRAAQLESIYLTITGIWLKKVSKVGTCLCFCSVSLPLQCLVGPISRRPFSCSLKVLVVLIVSNRDIANLTY